VPAHESGNSSAPVAVTDKSVPIARWRGAELVTFSETLHGIT
jgi:hypothetical protein